MTDFTPTPEAVEAVANAIYPTRHPRGTQQLKATHREMARAAIAAFVEAEGITEERKYRIAPNHMQRSLRFHIERANRLADRVAELEETLESVSDEARVNYHSAEIEEKRADKAERERDDWRLEAENGG